MPRETEEMLSEIFSSPEGRRTLEEMISELLPLIPETSLGPHVHKCGFDLENPDRSGCGHEWTHDGNDTQNAAGAVFVQTHDEELANRVYDDLHACPACGRGPWKSQVTDRTRRIYSRLKSEEIES